VSVDCVVNSKIPERCKLLDIEFNFDHNILVSSLFLSHKLSQPCLFITCNLVGNIYTDITCEVYHNSSHQAEEHIT